MVCKNNIFYKKVFYIDLVMKTFKKLINFFNKKNKSKSVGVAKNYERSKALLKFIKKNATDKVFIENLFIDEFGKINVINEFVSEERSEYQNQIFIKLVQFAVLFYGHKANLNFIETKNIKIFAYLFFSTVYLKLKAPFSHRLYFELFGNSSKEKIVEVNMEQFNGWINRWSFESAESCLRMFCDSKFNRHPIHFNFKNSVSCGLMFANSCYNHVVYIKTPVKLAYCMFKNAQITKSIYLDLQECEDSLDKTFFSKNIKINQLKGVKNLKKFVEDKNRFVVNDAVFDVVNLNKFSDEKHENPFISELKQIDSDIVFEMFFKDFHFSRRYNFYFKSDLFILLYRFHSLKSNFLSKEQYKNIVANVANKITLFKSRLDNNSIIEEFDYEKNTNLVKFELNKFKEKIYYGDDYLKSLGVKAIEKEFIESLEKIEKGGVDNKIDNKQFFNRCYVEFLRAPLLQEDEYKNHFLELTKNIAIELNLKDENKPSFNKTKPLLI